MRIARALGAGSIGLVAATACVAHSIHADHTGQHGAAPSPPHVEVAPLALTLAPTSAQLTAYLCPLLAAETALGSAASAACRQAGAAPALDDLATRVHLDASISSTNLTRLSVESAFVVVTLYPGAGASEVVGAACITLCDAGSTTCPQTEEACRSTDAHVLDVADVSAAHDFLTPVAVTEERPADLAVVNVPAHGSATLALDLALGTQPLLDAIRANDSDATTAIRAGHAPTFTVPYAIEGTIWVGGRGDDGFAEPIARTTGTLELPSR